VLQALYFILILNGEKMKYLFITALILVSTSSFAQNNQRPQSPGPNHCPEFNKFVSGDFTLLAYDGLNLIKNDTQHTYRFSKIKENLFQVVIINNDTNEEINSMELQLYTNRPGGFNCELQNPNDKTLYNIESVYTKGHFSRKKIVDFTLHELSETERGLSLSKKWFVLNKKK
jgi:chromosomal replication initiation ATPase DnaA